MSSYERKRSLQKRVYDNRKAACVCVDCGKVPPEDGRVRCEDCKVARKLRVAA